MMPRLLCLALAAVACQFLAAEPLGPSSRRTGLVISEIMLHPVGKADPAYVELYNAQPMTTDLQGWRISGAWDFTFTNQTMLAPGAFLVVAQEAAKLRARFGLTNVIGGLMAPAFKDSMRLRLCDRFGAVLLDLMLPDEAPWPAAAFGGGHSLVLANPSYGENDVRAWSASAGPGGSPGRAEPLAASGLGRVVINEILARPGPGQTGFVELYNYSLQPAEIGGWRITDDPGRPGYVLPPGTRLSPAGFLAILLQDARLDLNPAGGKLFLDKGETGPVVDALRYDGQAQGMSFGHSPDAAPDLYPLARPTMGKTNAPPQTSDVVLNEIMYHSPSGDDEEQYVELHNRSTSAVNLGGWRLRGGIRYEFADSAVVPAGGYVVVARNPKRLQAAHPELPAAAIFGGFKGRLSHQGERLVLEQPGAGAGIPVDEVTWQDGGRWGQWSDGGGSSLELREARTDHRRADHWGDSDELGKSAWTTVAFTGSLIQGDGGSSRRLELILCGAGECLVDDVEVIYQGTNLLREADAHFSAGLGNWVAQGNHEATHWQVSGGTSNSPCLYVRAAGRGDYFFNRVRVDLTQPIPANATATIRARARWLRGEPEMVLRLTGNFLEAAGRLPIPANLGTPGKPNHLTSANSGPAIFDVNHAPILPAAGQPVVISARLADPDVVASASVRYRVDGVPGFQTAPLADDGARGDFMPGDGIYSATLSGLNSGQLLAFRIVAVDGQSTTNCFPSPAPAFPGDPNGGECLVRFGEPDPALGDRRFSSYHIWATRAAFDHWSRRGSAHNGPLPATFVYQADRAVYSATVRYSGSFNTRAATSSPVDALTRSPLGGYNVAFPADEPVLGADEMALDSNARPGFAQHEQLAFWVARELGLPASHRRYVHVFLNGAQRTVFEDVQQPGRDLLKSYFPNDPGPELYKVEVWWQSTDFPQRGSYHAEPPLAPYLCGDAKNLARYRWTMQKRADQGAANDYRSVFALVDALNAPAANYTAAVEREVDVEEWMRALALERIVGNHDSWGRHAPHNLYACKPQKAGWQLIPFDMDYSFFGGEDPRSDLVNGAFFSDSMLVKMLNHPPFLRAYLRALHDAINGPLARDERTGKLARVNAVLDAHYEVISVVNELGPAELSPDYQASGWQWSLRGWFEKRHDAIRATLQRHGQPAFAAAWVAPPSANLWQGTAPIEVKTIQANGAALEVTWKTATSWQALVPPNLRRQAVNLQGVDRLGRPLSNASITLPPQR